MKVGDVVVLASGGPRMTVTKSMDDGSGAKVGVLWYAKSNGRGQFCTAEGLPASSFVVLEQNALPEIVPTFPLPGAQGITVK